MKWFSCPPMYAIDDEALIEVTPPLSAFLCPGCGRFYPNRPSLCIYCKSTYFTEVKSIGDNRLSNINIED